MCSIRMPGSLGVSATEAVARTGAASGPSRRPIYRSVGFGPASPVQVRQAASASDTVPCGKEWEGLQDNPSVALRAAREGPVVVLSRNCPEAVLVHLDDDTLLAEPGVRLALATALYRERSLSLGLAARFSGLATADFIQHVSHLGIPVVSGTRATVREDVQVIEAWESDS